MEQIILAYIKTIINHCPACKYPEEDCSCGELTAETKLITGGWVDSFSMVPVLVFVERFFDIKISDDLATAENFDSVRQIAELIDRLSRDRG